MTSTPIIPFLFEGEYTVREIEIGGIHKFVAKDVAAACGYKDAGVVIPRRSKPNQWRPIMVANAIPFAMCAVNDNFSHEGLPRLAVYKDRPGFPPVRLERWAARLLRRVN